MALVDYKCMLSSKKNDISKHIQLIAFLKRRSDKPKKILFNKENFARFLLEEDHQYLIEKVVLVTGVSGVSLQKGLSERFEIRSCI